MCGLVEGFAAVAHKGSDNNKSRGESVVARQQKGTTHTARVAKGATFGGGT